MLLVQLGVDEVMVVRTLTISFGVREQCHDGIGFHLEKLRYLEVLVYRRLTFFDTPLTLFVGVVTLSSPARAPPSVSR